MEPFHINNQILSILNKAKGFKIYGIAFYNTSKIQLNTKTIELNQKEFLINSILHLNISKSKGIFIYSINIPYKDILQFELNNQFFFKSTINSKQQKIPIRFLLFIKRGLLLRGKVQNINNSNISAYIRQGERNTVKLTVRETNITDKVSIRIKILFAYLLSFFYKFRKIHLLYEKLGDKYEESASVLYEKLIDLGYTNSYFLLSKEARKHFNIDRKYQKNLIEEHTFKHYLYFFSTKTFLGTESMPSAFEVRTISKIAMFYMRYSRYYNFVFLQHGIMYVVALESEMRKGFQYGSWFPKRTKIVVSSELEAKHFMEQGNYPRESLYLTGLPKFDKSVLHDDANQITIMPTWRNWEYIGMNNNPTETTYYKMLLSIYNAIPEQYKKYTNILVHPSFKGKLKGTPLETTVKEEYNYNNILQKTRLLITDYSSISFDAFFRGTNIIFWWKDKDESMKRYKGYLMLNKENIFGDIYEKEDSLSKLIEFNYNNKQSELYKKRFKKLVKYFDRKNTKRLIKKLEKDGFLYK